MKWVKSCLCYLRGAVVRLWVLCSRVGLECYLRLAAKSTNSKLLEKVVQMKILLSSKLSWLKEVIMSSGIFLVGLLLLWVLALFAFASCSVPSFRQAEFLSITNANGEGRTEFLFGLFSWPASQDPITLSSGHLAYMGQTALMGILGFYFGPSPSRR